VAVRSAPLLASPLLQPSPSQGGGTLRPAQVNAYAPGPSPISHPPIPGAGENFGKQQNQFFFLWLYPEFPPSPGGGVGGRWERGRG